MSPAAETSLSLLGTASIGLEKAMATLSWTKEIDEPESNIISTSLLSRNPLVMVALDRTIATTTTFATLEGLTASWGAPTPLEAPLYRFPNNILLLNALAFHTGSTSLLVGNSVVNAQVGGTCSTSRFPVVWFA